MLRWLTLALLLANLLVWSWRQESLGPLLSWTLPGNQHEPQRLNRQIQPDAIQVTPVGAAAAAASTNSPTTASAALATPSAAAKAGSGIAGNGASNPTNTTSSCLQLGPIDEDRFNAAVQSLLRQGLHSDHWVDIRRERSGRWAVYMGRFADAEQLQRKLDELTRLRLPHEELAGHASLSPGITLGRYDNEAEAQRRLAQLQSRGVRTARVVVLINPVVEHQLRLEPLSTEQAQQIRSAAGSPGWQPCTGPN